jgi:surfactin synthase thioesterase subunit
MDELLADIMPQIEAALSSPDASYSLVGHSMGGLIAFELAYEVTARIGLAPSLLVVAGRQPPHAPRGSGLTEGELRIRLRQRLDRLTGANLTDNRLDALADAMLPVFVSDVKVVQTYRCRPRPPLTCPIHVLAGSFDSCAPADDMAGWATYTTNACVVEFFDGGHFFIESQQAEVVDAVLRQLRATLVQKAVHVFDGHET